MSRKPHSVSQILGFFYKFSFLNFPFRTPISKQNHPIIMFTTLLQSFIFLLASSTAANIPSLSLTGSPLPLNASLPNDQLIDPRFRITARSLEPILLNEDAFLMNCVGVFGKITLADAEAPIVPRTYPEYHVPGVSIATVAATAGGTIEARFVVWGLYTVALLAMLTDTYQGAVYTLKWEGVVVGYLDISKPETRVSIPGSPSANASLARRSNGRDGTSRDLYGRGGSPNMTLTEPFRITINIIEKPIPLTKLQLFATCFAGFVFVARFPQAQEVELFEVQSGPGFGTTLRVGGEGFAFKNPDFKYKHVNTALISLARHSYEKGMFSEVKFQVLHDLHFEYDPIGFGYIWQRRPGA